MNHQVMVTVIDTIIAPYLNGHHGAMVMDGCRVHVSDAITAAASRNNIRIIYCPTALTYKRQPLDVGVIGSMNPVNVDGGDCHVLKILHMYQQQPMLLTI